MTRPRRPSGTPTGGQFAQTPRAQSDADLDASLPKTIDFSGMQPYDDDGEGLPATRHQVDAAKAFLDSLPGPSRPMYRGDWERINGGSGPTLGQVRDEANSRGESRSDRAQAQANYDRLLASWEASDKTQDADQVRCVNCGFWYDQYDGKCPECSYS